MNELLRRLRVLFRRDSFDADLDEEMRAHIEMQAEENRDNGMDPADARYAAQRRFGNAALLKEDSRWLWSWAWLDNLAQDIRFAFRLMCRNRGLTFVAILTLGIGIGGNTLVFTLVDTVLLQPLPFQEPNRLHLLWTVDAKSQRGMNSSYPDFKDWQEQSRTFQAMAAFRLHSFNLTGTAEPERVEAVTATPGLLEALGVQPVLGRAFIATDDARVVLRSHSIWTTRFGGDAGIVGRSTVLDGRSYTILGVLPSGFSVPVGDGGNPSPSGEAR